MANDPSEVDGLLDLARAGNVAVLDGVFSRYRERLRQMVQLRLDRRLQGRIDPSDVLQEAFVDAVRQLAQRGHEAPPEHPQLHYALGALQYRTGDYAEALQTLASFGEVGETAVGAKSSSAYPLFFVAMVQQKLGQAEQARATLTRASNLAEQEFARPDKLVWNRKLTLELLREEAIALIGPVAIRPPAPALPEAAAAR